MVRERPAQRPGDRSDLEDPSGARDRLSCYKGSGRREGECVDRPAREGVGGVPERPVGVPTLGAERGVHDDDVRGGTDRPDRTHLERHRDPCPLGGGPADGDRLGVDVHPPDRPRAQERGPDREAAGPAAEVDDRPAREAVPPLHRLEEHGGGLRRGRDLLERRVGCRERGDPLEAADELRATHDPGTPGGRNRWLLRPPGRRCGEPDLNRRTPSRQDLSGGEAAAV
jgi:hypothetical protein